MYHLGEAFLLSRRELESKKLLERLFDLRADRIACGNPDEVVPDAFVYDDLV